MAALAAMESSTGAHLDADTLAAYVDGRLAAEQLGLADRHIDECRSCRAELSVLAAIHTQPAAPQGDAPQGSLGRYHLLRELGRGSMGIVLRAYDPELARPVAIKLVRDVDAETRELLRREARSLAKLRHPNVVTVYDVIVEADGLYVAMELVEGDTLRGYSKGKSTNAILAACVRAGKGLAAAHDAGVIHRDFKPENVLCGERGEVKVSDFGLARAADETPDAALAGTPAYMAPEVLRREPATAASDQFSFCVTVWELLTGERPTGGAPPKASVAFAPIPTWIIRVLRRGLERDPAIRFPSMHALVAALEDDPVVRRRRRMVLAAGALALLATGALAMQLAPAREAATCELDSGALGSAWTIERRISLASAITAAGDADTAARVVRALDGHAAEWIASRRETCVASREHAEPALIERQVACLDRNRRELGALAQLLGVADRKLAANALEAVGHLADPAACATSAQVLPDAVAGRVMVEQGRSLLSRANVLQYAGRSDEADAVASQLLEQLGTELAPGLRAEALLTRARVAVDRGRYEEAEPLLFDALHAAERGRDDVLVATLWVEIVSTTGAQQHRFDLALSNVRAADAALARIDPGPELQLRYAYVLGTTLLAHGKLEDARKRLSSVQGVGAADARRQAALGLDELALCDVDRQLGDLKAADPLCESGMKRLETALGPTHVQVGISLSQLGALAYVEHDLAAAERFYQRAVQILELRNARDHYAYALALSNIGTVYTERDEPAKAEDYYRRSRALFEAHHPTHPQRLMPLQGLAGLALRRGDAAAAIPLYQQIRDIRAATYASEHPMLLISDYNLALAYRANKQPAEAAKLLADITTRALAPGKESWTLAARAFDLAATLAEDARNWPAAIAMRERAVVAIAKSPEAMERALADRHLGETLVHAGQPAPAIAPLQRALVGFDALGASAYEKGATGYMLARALWDANHRRRNAAELAACKQALVLATAARDDLAKAVSGGNLVAYRANVAGFIRETTKLVGR